MTIKHFRIVYSEEKIEIQWLNLEEDLWMTECTYRLVKHKWTERTPEVRAVAARIFEKIAYINSVWHPTWSFVIEYEDQPYEG